MTISSQLTYRELPVYQMAFQGSVAVHDWAQPLLATADADADVVGQLLTTSRAICAHIAAAWSQRRRQTGLILHLSTAQLAAAEMQSWIESAIVLGKLTPDAAQDLHDYYRDLYNALDQLMASTSAVSTFQQSTPTHQLPATA